ncbi:MAG: AbrB/MazE/SpoVT family DNA-binding domain-containing protein [Candidatus Woesearchaeota archaeon]
MKLIERSVQEIGKSLLITLPKGWADATKIKKGSLVKMTISDQGILTIAPEFNKPESPKEVVMQFDKYFARRFFREYFHGNEKITFLLDKNMLDADRKKLSILFSKFMNVQVIEETSSKIVVKCFKIEELSIQECMMRMYHLSMNMFDEFLEKNDRLKLSAKLDELDDSITKFYYMQVMQIRRYLTEGKFTEQNQITLTRAMDFRMVAEKVERIADILKTQENTVTPYNDKDFVKNWIEVKKYFSSSFFSFIDKKYDVALDLMIDYQTLFKKYSSMISEAEKKGQLKKYIQYKNLLQIVSYSKEISMLVR